LSIGRARALLVLAATLWGSSFVANHQLLIVLSPKHMIVLRFLVVTVVLLAIGGARAGGGPPLTVHDALTLVALGVLAVPGTQLVLVTGQRFLSPAMSGLVAAVGPAFSATLAWLFLRERTSRRARVGVVIAVLGVAGVVLLASGTGTALTIRDPRGAALVPLAQVAWAGYTVLSRSFAGRHAPLRTLTLAMASGTFVMLPVLPGALRAAQEITLVHWGWIVHLAVLGTVIPYLIWVSALVHLPAAETAAFMFLVPIAAIGWSALVIGERPSGVGLAAGAVVLVGVALTQSRRTPSPRGPQTPGPTTTTPDGRAAGQAVGRSTSVET
jgi:drug/metabolite transporter (DMT)-like permease